MCAFSWYIKDIIDIQKMHGMESFMIFLLGFPTKTLCTSVTVKKTH